MSGVDLAHLRKTRAERAVAAVLPASAAVWTAAEIMHLAAWPGTLDTAAAAAFASVAAWGASARWPKIPRRLPWWIAAAGGWLTLAVTEGPLHAFPYAPLTWTWLAASAFAWWKVRRHPAVITAQEWRGAKIEWLGKSRRWGLGGSHLLEFSRTRLGEAYDVDVRGTRKRASQIATSHTAELIAEDECLPISRVQVKPHRLAGRVRISIRREDPWAKPIFHPVIDDDPEIDLCGAYSIRKPATVGQDPETGHPLGVPLHDETGGKNVNIVAIKGSGKTTILDDLSERITAAPDAMQIRINLSVKGHAEAERWGPACHLTAFGPHQKARAVQVLKVVNQIIEWRSQRYTVTKYVPSPGDPQVTVIVDESDSAMAIPAVRKEVDGIATKGREYGVTLVRAGQRGTTDYGSAKTRAQDDVFVIGMVNRTGEVYHAAGNLGLSLPDMASYGEGRSGVWAVAELGGQHHMGRAFLMEPADAARLAAERALSQPELPEACRKFLGESYEVLLSTDVFAKWARDKADREGREFMASRPHAGPDIPGGLDSPLAPLAQAVRDGHVKADPETEHALLEGLRIAEEDALRELDFDMDIDDATRAKLAAIDRKLDNNRRMLAETAGMREQAPEVSPEALAAHTAARWGMVAEEIPPEFRQQILALLAGEEGMSGRKIVEALTEKNPQNAPKRATVMLWLGALRSTGFLRLDGKGPNARWKLTQGGDGS